VNLAWLVAVLQPHDVAPHPNFPNEEYDALPAARLAAVVSGDPWRLRQSSKFSAAAADNQGERGTNDVFKVVLLAERCLQSDTIGASVATLAEVLSDGQISDTAEAVALTLILCSAAAELDDYSTCFAILEAQVQRVSAVPTPDYSLLRSALLQQWALRLRDAGQPHLERSLEAARTLEHLDVTMCSDFAVNPGITTSPDVTLEQIRGSLRSAAISLTSGPHSNSDAQIISGSGVSMLPKRAPALPPTISVRTNGSRADTYADYVEQVFVDRFGNQTRSIGGAGQPDLFSTLLGLELLGHHWVRTVRKDLALLRLVQPVSDPANTADALRLLRHAPARNQLDIVLRRLQMGGPLAALSHDARQVLRTRTQPEQLRTVELRVLNVAAELLAPPEARVGLAAIRASLAAGGPPNLQGEWQLDLLRRAVAWEAAAALGNACGQPEEVAQLILNQANNVPPEDELLDDALLPAVARLEWANIPPRTQQAWVDFLQMRAAQLTSSASAVLNRTGREAPASTAASPLAGLSNHLNALLRGGTVDHSAVRNGVPVVRDALAAIRSDAARGTYSIGGVNVAHTAAVMVSAAPADTQELWPVLIDFLIDSAVNREDRSAAFEWLADSEVHLPPTAADLFRERAQDLLMTAGPDTFLEPPSLVPYPSALRFLGSHRLLEDADVYDAIAELAGGGAAGARREAALTVAALAAVNPRSELLVLALPLSRDPDIEVRAQAGRGLVVLMHTDETLAMVVQRRLRELLEEDGLLAPLIILRAMAKLTGGLPEVMRAQIRSLAQQHPSRSVRAEAERLGDGLDAPEYA